MAFFTPLHVELFTLLVKHSFGLDVVPGQFTEINGDTPQLFPAVALGNSVHYRRGPFTIFELPHHAHEESPVQTCDGRQCRSRRYAIGSVTTGAATTQYGATGDVFGRTLGDRRISADRRTEEQSGHCENGKAIPPGPQEGPAIGMPIYWTASHSPIFLSSASVGG